MVVVSVAFVVASVASVVVSVLTWYIVVRVIPTILRWSH
jgi:hypothetical protein